MDSRPIGMFDSGVGGLTVYKEVRKMFPGEDIIYFGDTKSFPYGSKSKEAIISLAEAGVRFLISHNVKLIVVACGTATSQALDTLKEEFDIPIIGIIEPAAKFVAEDSKVKNVGVMATAGTIRSNCWKKTLLKLNSKLNVENKACPMLAPMAEEGWTNNEIAKLAVHEYIKDFGKLDALILGCTHYPLYTKILKEELPDTKIVNPGEVLAQSLKEILDSSKERKGTTEIYLSDLECNFIEVAKKILNVDELEAKKCDM